MPSAGGVALGRTRVFLSISTTLYRLATWKRDAILIISFLFVRFATGLFIAGKTLERSICMVNTYHTTDSGVLYQGDALEVLKGMEAESVSCVITSPPYW